MVKFNYYFIKAIRDVLSLDTIKLSLLIGIPLFLVWLGIGWLTLDIVASYTYKIITWMPFSIIRANGAFVIVFFIWLLAMLVSYAFIIGLFNAFFYKIVESRYYEFLNVLIILSIAIFWSVVIILNWNFIFEEIKKLLTWLPFETVDKGVSYLLAVYIFYNFFVITLYLIVFIFKKPYLTALKESHYSNIEILNHIKSSKAYSLLFRDIFLFAIFTIATIPVFFIPFANLLVILLLWTWLYKESAFVGVCSLFCAENEYEEIKHHRVAIWLIAFVASLLNFIPIISFFTPFFVLTMYFHYIIHFKRVRS